jgi:hypothetical protein
MFALGFPGRLEELFHRAGFTAPEVQAVAVPRRYASTAAAVRALQATPLLRAATATLAEAERESIWAEVEHALRQFERDGGFEAPGEVLVGVGTR